MGQDHGRRWWGDQRINRTDTGHNILVDTEVTQVITEVGLEKERQPRAESVSFQQITKWEQGSELEP